MKQRNTISSDWLLGWTIPAAIMGAVITFAACASDPVDPGAHECPVDTNETAGSGNEGGASNSAATTDAAATTSTGSGSTGSGSQEFSPQEVAAKLHGCRKLRFQTLGNMLVDRGVDITSLGGNQTACQTDANGPFCLANESCYCPAPPCVQVGNDNGNQGICVASPATPGFLYSTANDAFSFPKIDSRQGEKDGHSTASAIRLFDIFVQAAPQIIQNIEDPAMAPACVRQGMTAPMFDPVDGSCVEQSVTCLMGMPATEDHLLLCNLLVEKADPFDPADIAKKQEIAVAALLSAAHSCE